MALGKRRHWLPVAAAQDLAGLSAAKAEEGAAEWSERQRLSAELTSRLALAEDGLAMEAVRELLDPYWGFDCWRPAGELNDLLTEGPATAPSATSPV